MIEIVLTPEEQLAIARGEPVRRGLITIQPGLTCWWEDFGAWMMCRDEFPHFMAQRQSFNTFIPCDFDFNYHTGLKEPIWS